LLVTVGGLVAELEGYSRGTEVQVEVTAQLGCGSCFKVRGPLNIVGCESLSDPVVVGFLMLPEDVGEES
jgi:hypothetical protein